jgi:hypothetical protein
MLGVLSIIAMVLIVCFGFVLAFGAPYLPTLTRQTEAALDLAELRAGQTLLELGCGDGKVLIAAARRGVHVVGYELNPLLVLICWLRTWRYRRLVTVKWGNFWTQQWPESDAIFVFLLQKYMPKLDKKIIQYNHKPVKLISFAFTMPGRDPVRSQDGVHLYQYN